MSVVEYPECGICIVRTDDNNDVDVLTLDSFEPYNPSLECKEND